MDVAGVDSMGNLDSMLEEDDDDLEVCLCSQTYLDSLYFYYRISTVISKQRLWKYQTVSAFSLFVTLVAKCSSVV
jgi:hypothetical protein